ncbi:Protein N-acetyltransferase, RimJ/RimL family [Halogranum amylolyticum]|uniref:Protein N-acetyltransferase, RimJ/RimL family n=1 Tax=Halogranum amylolyticum TaxID=660520 RepID=A0A1H8T447_9EURY|nr:GNAT family protein [Halogranum amylolyticum]SEO85711.1 Protein N-acetyltransferase, RimJ/RimL family [Halogranum amylolyticum]
MSEVGDVDTTVVAGDRVSLRPVERDDAAFLQRSTTDPEIRIPLGSTSPSNEHETESFIEEVIESDDGVSLLVEADEKRIGLVATKSLDPARPELVYWFAPEYHGDGYGTEAVGLFVDYLFRTVDCHGLHARVFAFNGGSRGVLERLGFAEEGRFREARFVDGAYVDVVHFGLLRRDWESS